MQICILSGSQREKSNSLKCAKYIAVQLQRQGVETILLDMNEMDVAIWSQEFWAADTDESKEWSEISTILRKSDGFIAVSPEYSGMVPPRLKNFLLKCSGPDTGNKPVMLVGVSSGFGGTYPLVEMRNNAFKNNHMCVIPQAVIVRKATECFNGDTPESDVDTSTRNAIEYALSHLVSYAEALAHVREKGVTDYSRYPYGV